MLLAKSRRDGQPEKTLPAHTADVIAAVTALFGTIDQPTDLARSWIRFFCLSANDFARFLRHLLVAGVLHDTGKANDGMQAVLDRQGDQLVYHEHVSGLLAAESAVQEWLKRSDLDAELILAAVLGHHLRVGHKTLLQFLSGEGSVVRLLLDDEDFRSVWAQLGNRAGCQDSAPFPARRRWTATDLAARAAEVGKALLALNSALRPDHDRRRLLTAVRAALIVADAVGSAVIRLPGDRRKTANDADRVSEWVVNCLGTPITPEFIRDTVIEPRKKELGDRFRNFNDFQRGMTDQPSRVLLTAPCGSGKTLAAWKWIEGQVGRNRATRAIFLYPTRATATEGFRDYVSWAPEATLVSGTADFDLEGMFQSPDDPRTGRDYRADPRLYALGLWSKSIFSATADQFLPFLQYGYGQVCLLPLLAESVLVVDEVHSFDLSMFSTLKRFLKEFSVPVLCMTATLPEERRRDLEVECGLKPYPEATPDDLAEIAEHPRYRVEWVDSDRGKAVAETWLERRSRVLWVVNRVDDCRNAYNSMTQGARPWPSFCYHSRYRLIDRRERHNELIGAFQAAAWDSERPKAMLGVTTQVCEMSLDLDADVLITELAPIPALIQRMGRCNRDNKRMLSEKRVGEVFVIRRQPGREKPYDASDLDAAGRFVDAIAGKSVSQSELEVAFRDHDNSAVEPTKLCPFLDSGAYATAGEESFRDTDEFTVPCVLNGRDLENVLKSLRARERIDGFIVPVPRRYVAHHLRPDDPRFPRWLNVAMSEDYDTVTGFGTTPANLQTQKESP